MYRILAIVAMLGCGGSDPSDITLSTTELACPSDSLTLTIAGGFPSDTTVQFKMGSTILDGSAVVLNDGTIDCGLPSTAAPGEYQVIIDGNSVGTVTLDATNCVTARAQGAE